MDLQQIELEEELDVDTCLYIFCVYLPKRNLDHARETYIMCSYWIMLHNQTEMLLLTTNLIQLGCNTGLFTKTFVKPMQT